MASIKRQTHRPDLWIVGDQLARDRIDTGVYAQIRNELNIDIHVFNARELTDQPFTIATGYHEALRYCRVIGNVDLLVTMEDYTWIPRDGFERFERMADQLPNSLLAGIVSGSKDPDPSLVVDPEGLLTIFAEPYEDEPQVLDWEDCRSGSWTYWHAAD